jgi:hypothetical protein
MLLPSLFVGYGALCYSCHGAARLDAHLPGPPHILSCSSPFGASGRGALSMNLLSFLKLNSIFIVYSYARVDSHGRAHDFTTTAIDIQVICLLRRYLLPVFERLGSAHEFAHSLDLEDDVAQGFIRRLNPQQVAAFNFLRCINERELQRLFNMSHN